MSAGGYRDVFDADVTHVWQGSTVGPLGADDERILSAAEQDRARRMTSPAGLHYAGAHAAVRRILGRYLEVAPERLRLGRLRCPECAGTDHGAPCVVWPPTDLSYSLSRSGPHWLLAVTSGFQVGVDLEDMPGVETAEVGPIVLSDAELAYLDAQPDPDRRLSAFLRCWTRKEAVLKASGVGLIADVRAVEVQPQAAGPVVIEHAAATGPGRWVVEDVPVRPGHYAAIAREQAGAGPLLVRDYPAGFTPPPADHAP
ncbi:4'-phosphopantetheinyl transferase family protein [Kitasatospora sp. HPMI-4]|uniref:4'-phosphopantetheinyl transferase family protein n=1 Tax=Kitasatospora sp. HPMI-4 TaxID=3448443 RepID=UPI003F1DF17A